MIQGTGSNSGKSLLVTGLCRLWARQGLRVRPFKPQNMSNNAAATPSGEIGRAQALQAQACGVEPQALMNPVLLKPEGERNAQVIVNGAVWGRVQAQEYRSIAPQLLAKVLDSFHALRTQCDVVVIEGAGSPAEANLRAGDIANMGFARSAQVPVVLCADVERGGALANLCGTAVLLEPEDRALIAGYCVNRFRGDPALFSEAERIITERTGWPSMGIVPAIFEARWLPKEDSVGLESHSAPASETCAVTIIVPMLGRMANTDDLDPLRQETNVDLRIIPQGQPLPEGDIVILGGSKTTCADLDELRAQGWDIDILAHHRRGGTVVGLCAGYQMLGSHIHDPQAHDSAHSQSTPGLGLLRCTTSFAATKHLGLSTARFAPTGATVRGYEIHMGTTRSEEVPMLVREDGGDCGSISACGRVMGCYLHGLFAEDAFRQAFLAQYQSGVQSQLRYARRIEDAIERIADVLEASLDMPRLRALAGLS